MWKSKKLLLTLFHNGHNKKLQQDGPNLEDCMCQCNDNQATMTGIHSGISEANFVSVSVGTLCFLQHSHPQFSLCSCCSCECPCSNIFWYYWMTSTNFLVQFTIALSTLQWSTILIWDRAQKQLQWLPFQVKFINMISALEQLHDTLTETFDSCGGPAQIRNGTENF